MTQLLEDRILLLLSELKSAYHGFTWESELWAESGHGRSTYRTLVLFGLSARTRDPLLVYMCRKFFQRFPDAASLSALRQAQDGREAVEREARSIVRDGQLPIVVSMAESVLDGVPRLREELLGIKGVGDKIAECVLAYGWGDEALPLDAHCVRVLARVFGLEKKESIPGPLREGLKCVYGRHRRQFAELSIAMVDIHEILRLHGQVCCGRTPECAGCPVSGCRSRREPWDESNVIEVSPSMWDDWRELIYEPVAV